MPAHFRNVSGEEGVFVGPKGSEVRVAAVGGILYNLGVRLIPAGETVVTTASGETAVMETASLKVEKYVTLSLAFDDDDIDTGITIASLPAGAIVTSFACKIDTAWNSGTTDALSVGYGASLNEIVNAFDCQSTGLATVVTGILPLVRATATDVKVKVASDGTAADAGAATIVLGYI